MREVVIIDGCRTAVGKQNGGLVKVRADELLATVLAELMERTSVDKSLVEDVIIGCVTQTKEQAMNVARTGLLIAGFPYHVPGVTLDRQCGSSQQAVHFAAQAILAGDMDIVIAGGVESMTRSPLLSNVAETTPSERLTKQYDIVHQGISAELIAEKWNLSREELDEFALRSNERAIQAIDKGLFQDEIVPIETTDSEGNSFTFAIDEGPRRDATRRAMSELTPVFKKGGKITAGNSSQMSDGASAVLIMSAEKATELGLTPRAKILARTVIGSDPTLMLTGPIAATEQIVKRTKITLDEIDRYEVNEAFAPVPLAWLRETKANDNKLNVLGGAIALGHPLGATGTKLITSLMNELDRIDGKYGLIATCEGAGMANATIIERIS